MGSNGSAAFVSVVMPVRNEGAFITRSLGAVLAQDYPPDRLEVIIADGMSTDGTREVVTKAQATHPNVRLVDNPARIVPAALNAAIEQARGDVIVRVDGHCEIAPDYVRRCVQHLTDDDVDGVGGPLETVGTSTLSEGIAVAMSSRFGVGGAEFRTTTDKTTLTDTVAFPAYSRDILQRAGPFDVELVRNQDDEYNYRLRKLGARILLAADVRSRYYSRGTLASLWRQYFQYGYWKVRVMQKHPRQMRPRHFVPPAFVLVLFGTALLACFFPLGRVLLAVVAGSYAAANLTASVATARERGWRHLPILPAAFATLHVGWGLGFLTGLIRFHRRWRSQSPALQPRGLEIGGGSDPPASSGFGGVIRRAVRNDD